MMLRGAREWRVGALLASALLVAACVDPVLDDRSLEVDATGTVVGGVFLDLDGNGTPGAGEASAGVGVSLVVGGTGFVASATTDSAGTFTMDSVPVGSYRLRVERATLPPGTLIATGDSVGFVLALGDTARHVVRLSFPVATLAEVRALPPGRRVFTHGIALNARLPFGDGAAHLQSGAVYLRATGVDRAGFQPGDSVRFLGTTARSEGQPVLTDVRPSVVVGQAALVRPLEAGTAEAAAARAGSLDAALVRVRSAVVTDTATYGEDMLLTVNDGGGPVLVHLRDFLGFNRSSFRPGLVQLQEGTGLLVPYAAEGGTTEWRLTPRSTADLIVRSLVGAVGPSPENPPGR